MKPLKSIILIIALLAMSMYSFAQSPIPDDFYQKAQRAGAAGELFGVTYNNVEPTGYSGSCYVVKNDTTIIFQDNAGCGVIYNSNGCLRIYGDITTQNDTLWQDYAAPALFFSNNDTLYTLTSDSIHTSFDDIYLASSITNLPGTILSKFRIVMRGSDADTGWKLSLWSKAVNDTTYTATQIGTTQIFTENGMSVKVFDFADFEMQQSTTYYFGLISQVPPGETATLHSIGWQTTKRKL